MTVKISKKERGEGGPQEESLMEAPKKRNL